MYALTEEDAQASNALVSEILPVVYFAHACVLFDPRATHSFISSVFVQKHSLPAITLDHDLYIATTVEHAVVVDKACVGCLIWIKGHELLANLHVMSMKDYDIIF